MNIPKVTIKKILYTTDLSESGRQAFSYAASLTRQYDAELTVLHVIKAEQELSRSLVGYISDELWEDIKKQSLEEAREALLKRKRDDVFIRKCVGDYCDEIMADGSDESYISYDIALKFGHPVEKILEFVDSGEYDVMVMASHGHTVLEDTMLGTTVRRVLRRATIPVLIVRTP